MKDNLVELARHAEAFTNEGESFSVGVYSHGIELSAVSRHGLKQSKFLTWLEVEYLRFGAIGEIFRELDSRLTAAVRAHLTGEW